MIYETRRILQKFQEELVHHSTLDWLVLNSRAGRKVLPECATILPPPRSMRVHPDGAVVPRATRLGCRFSPTRQGVTMNTHSFIVVDILRSEVFADR